MKIKTFLNNNSTLFFSWYCVIFCVSIENVIFKKNLSSYLWYILGCCLFLLLAFVILSIFYSFYQSIRNIKINKKYAFVLLILYLAMAWMFLIIDLFENILVFILISICIYLYHKFNKQNVSIIAYLLFYGINSFFILIFLFSGMVHDC